MKDESEVFRRVPKLRKIAVHQLIQTITSVLRSTRGHGQTPVVFRYRGVDYVPFEVIRDQHNLVVLLEDAK